MRDQVPTNFNAAQLVSLIDQGKALPTIVVRESKSFVDSLRSDELESIRKAIVTRLENAGRLVEDSSGQEIVISLVKLLSAVAKRINAPSDLIPLSEAQPMSFSRDEAKGILPPECARKVLRVLGDESRYHVTSNEVGSALAEITPPTHPCFLPALLRLHDRAARGGAGASRERITVRERATALVDQADTLALECMITQCESGGISTADRGVLIGSLNTLAKMSPELLVQVLTGQDKFVKNLCADPDSINADVGRRLRSVMAESNR